MRFFQKYARDIGVKKGEEFARRLRKKISVQAPLRISRTGRVYAATRATPGAPPRRVTGALQASVKTQKTAHGLKVNVYKPYGWFLEYSRKHPHKFFEVVLKEMGLR
jgi:hypothetical protein